MSAQRPTAAEKRTAPDVAEVPKAATLLSMIGLSMEVRMHHLFFPVIPIAVLAAAALPTRAEALSLRFSWVGIPACASISPAFDLGDVPAGTKRLTFMLTDLNVPAFHHGGSTIAYDEDAVRRGAIRHTGPCPPRGERHDYRWTVEALDAAGKVLATGSAEAMFPP